MTDYWFKMFTFIRKSIFLVTILLASFCLLIQLSTNTKSDSSITSCNVEEQSKTRAAQKFHISSMCNCSKRVPIGGDESSGFKWCSDESSIRGRHQKIITYTVFGDAQDDASVFRRYFSSIRNISQTASKMYPGWVMRIYHNVVESQSEAQKQLCKVFCRHPSIDLCSINRIADQIQPNSTTPIDPKLIRGLNPKMFRYLVMLDPNVDVFISRDIDSLIWHREVDAVKEWLSSNYTFHLMRDHTGQDAIISAGFRIYIRFKYYTATPFRRRYKFSIDIYRYVWNQSSSAERSN